MGVASEGVGLADERMGVARGGGKAGCGRSWWRGRAGR